MVEYNPEVLLKKIIFCLNFKKDRLPELFLQAVYSIKYSFFSIYSALLSDIESQQRKQLSPARG